MKRVNVLCALDLRQLIFRPREFERDARVQRLLRLPRHLGESTKMLGRGQSLGSARRAASGLSFGLRETTAGRADARGPRRSDLRLARRAAAEADPLFCGAVEWREEAVTAEFRPRRCQARFPRR
jgi:hypothetical protein